MLKPLSIVMATLLTSMTSYAAPKVATDGNRVHVGHVTWQKTGGSYETTPAANIPADQAKVVFIRSPNNTIDQSSANISLNNHYLVSLQAGHYTQSLICSGQAELSVLPTGFKSNDLQAKSKLVDLQPQQTYYFYVDVDAATNQPTLNQITADSAQQLLASKAYQTHQISRVINNCVAPTSIVAPVVVVPAQPPVEVVQTVAPQDIPTLRLNILFDYDKSVVKAQYRDEIAKAAQFLANYPNATAVIEGHTDAKGSDSYNQKLSQRRAEAVRQALISQQGVDANRISAVGYGEARPIASNATEAGREQNRRVMVVTPKQAQ